MRNSPNMLFLHLLPIFLTVTGVSCIVEGPGRPYKHRGLATDAVDLVVSVTDECWLPDFVERLESSLYNANVQHVFHRTRAVSMNMVAANLELLEEDDCVDLVEKDEQVHVLADPVRVIQGEEIPWGVTSVLQSTEDKYIPSADPNAGCFKVCIVDSGLFVGHSDIPYYLNGPGLEGRSFHVPSNQPWYRPSPLNRHGTHVTGSFLASRGNNQGVAGVVGDSSNICLAFARVFPDFADTNMGSAVEEAVEWCADIGAKVINLSLGGIDPTRNSERMYRSLVHDDGILVIAASGNDGTNVRTFPASFSEVVSIGAVDQRLNWASFSQYNDQIDLVGPGQQIVSTVPEARVVDNRGNDFLVTAMQFSSLPAGDTLSASTVDCGQGTNTCSNASGKICLIERGVNQFSVKAHNCKRGGGVAMIVYNNQEGPVTGTLGSYGVSMPAVGITRTEGLQLKSASIVTMKFLESSYASYTGTSMAAPHVSGIAARIWAARPACTNLQVREALERTAKDLGPPGRDEKYGNGLPQGADAYNYLLGLPPPCGLGGVPPPPQPQTTTSTKKEPEKEDPPKMYDLRFKDEDEADQVRGGLHRRHRRRRILRGRNYR